MATGDNEKRNAGIEESSGVSVPSRPHRVVLSVSETPQPWDRWKGLMEYARYNVRQEGDFVYVEW